MRNNTRMPNFALSLKSENGLAVGRTETSYGRTGQIGILIKLHYTTENSFVCQWRAIPYWLGGLQRQRTLKSCFSEFHHIASTPFFVYFKKKLYLCSPIVHKRMNVRRSLLRQGFAGSAFSAIWRKKTRRICKNIWQPSSRRIARTKRFMRNASLSAADARSFPKRPARHAGAMWRSGLLWQRTVAQRRNGRVRAGGER